MSRFLFFISPFYGHVNPALYVARGLTGRGEDVTFYTKSQYRDAVEAAGATFRSISGPRVSSGDSLEVAALEMAFHVLQATVDSARSEKPDCIIYDPMSLSGMLLARILDVPAARLYTHFPINEEYHPFDIFMPPSPARPRYDAFDRDMQKVCDFYRVPAIGYHEAQYYAEPLNIVPFPAGFVPAAESFGERFHFVGPLFDVSLEGNGLPSKESLLYVSLGTIVSDMSGFYDICITAFGNQSRRVVISTGDKIDHSLFGPIPDQVSLHRRVPQMEVLSQASAFITHGGASSVMEALYYGVPMVAVPMRLEQIVVVKRMTELKLGLVVEPQNVTSHVLRNTVARLEEDQEIHSAVARMQELIRESSGHRKAVDLLVQYAS